jgi:hypothetical protein
MEQEELVAIVIQTGIQDIENAKKQAGDLAWEHATGVAHSSGMSLGSEEFETLFRELSLNYEEQTKYIKFFIMTAMMTVRDLLENNCMALPNNGSKISEDQVLELVSQAARCIMSSYMWLSSSKKIWPTNDDMEEVVEVPFYFDKNDILITEEEQDEFYL